MGNKVIPWLNVLYPLTCICTCQKELTYNYPSPITQFSACVWLMGRHYFHSIWARSGNDVMLSINFNASKIWSLTHVWPSVRSDAIKRLLVYFLMYNVLVVINLVAFGCALYKVRVSNWYLVSISIRMLVWKG